MASTEPWPPGPCRDQMPTHLRLHCLTTACGCGLDIARGRLTCNAAGCDGLLALLNCR